MLTGRKRTQRQLPSGNANPARNTAYEHWTPGAYCTPAGMSTG